MSPTLLAFSSKGAQEVPLDDTLSFLLKSREAEDREILGCEYGQFGLSLLVFGISHPRHRHWALMGSGPGHKSSSPTIAPQNPVVRILGRIGGF